MRLSDFVGNAGLLQGIGWSLLHFLWQGSILAMVLSGFLQVTRSLSSNVRYLVSCCVFALMLLCPLGTFVYLAANGKGSSYAYALALRPQAETLSLRSGWGYASSSLFERFAVAANHEMRWIVVLWCAGALVLLTYLLIGSVAVERLRATSLLPVSDAFESMAARLGKRLKVTRSFRVFSSSAVDGPVVIGWLRPVILIPLASLTNLPVEQLEAILGHELAHIKRHDYVVNTVQTIAEALLFYHPAVWWVSRQIRREREHCCDDVAVMICGSPLSYAKALSTLEEQRGTASYQLILGANGGDLAMRIKRILKHKEASITLRGTALWLMSIGVVMVVALFSASNLAANGAPAQAGQKLASPSPDGKTQELAPASSDGQEARVIPDGKEARVISDDDAGRPDMNCTYYDQGQALEGTCEVHDGDDEHFYCTEKEGEKRTQHQQSCKWKVERLKEWESLQHPQK